MIATITATGTKHLIAVVTDATAFTATAGHPIWVQAQGWTDAADLAVGDQLTGSGGQVHTITEVTDLGPLPDQDVYNLTISATHTYYVTGQGGNLDTLVHNCRPASAIDGRNLNRQLASQQQMAESGTRIAGFGTGSILRNRARLASAYGGGPYEWAKMSSSRYRGTDGFGFETHWYQNVRTGNRVEYKTKIV